MRYLVAAVIIVIMVVLIYYIASKGGGGGYSASTKIRDGSSLMFSCRGDSGGVKITKATYGPATTSSCESVDVTASMQTWVNANPGAVFTVGPDAFEDAHIPACSAPRVLTVNYTCVSPSREHIVPRRVNTCLTSGPDAQNVLPAAMADSDYSLHQWTGQDNENWTVEVTPWDPDSRIQLTTAALTAGARQMHRPINPITRIGITDRVLNWDNPYAGDDISSSPCSTAVSVFDVQPFQPGFLVPGENDSTDGTSVQQRYYYQPAYWSRASGPYGGPYRPVASCGIDDDAGPCACTT